MQLASSITCSVAVGTEQMTVTERLERGGGGGGGGVTAIELWCTASKSAGNRHARHHNICMHDQPTSSVWKEGGGGGGAHQIKL